MLFLNCINNCIVLDYYDLGFFYILFCIVEYCINGDVKVLEVIIKVVDKLMECY